MQNFLAISRFSGPPWDLEAKPWDRETVRRHPKLWVSQSNCESWKVWFLQSFAVKQGWGIGKFCVAWGSGICQPWGHPWAFELYVHPYPNITEDGGFYAFFLVMEWNFCWSRTWINLVVTKFLVLLRSIYFLMNFLYFFILLIYLEQKTF